MIRWFGRSMLLAALVIVLAAAGTACGGGDESATTKQTTYTNAQYGFEITYAEPLSQVNMTASGGADYEIAFADKDGPLVDDQYANGVMVIVKELERPVKAADVRKLGDDEEFKRTLKKSFTDAGRTITSDVEMTEINGVPGFTLTYEGTLGGEQLTCRLTVLYKDKLSYSLTEQTVSDDWTSMESTLHQVVQSFTTF